MSSRQLRKLQQQRELEQAKHDAGANIEESDEDEDDVQPPTSNKASLFANLALLEDEAEDQDEAHSEPEQEPEDKSDEESLRVASPKKSKKSKKKKKAKAKMVTADAIQDAKASHKSNAPDEIDAALAALKLKDANKGIAEEDAAVEVDHDYERVCQLLGVSTQHLKVGNEMRNLFGRTAVENHDDAEAQAPRGQRRRQRAARQAVDLESALKGHHAPGKGLPELTMRRNIFIQGKDDWPRGTTGGLSMEVETEADSDGVVIFKFVHDQAYETLQQQFNTLVEMGDPQNLIGFLQRNRMFSLHISAHRC